MKAWFAGLAALLCLGASPSPPGVALDLLLAETPAPKLADYRLFTDASGRKLVDGEQPEVG